MACGVSWHTQEIGSIIELGAQPRDVLNFTLRQEKVPTDMQLVAGMPMNMSAMDPG